MKAQRRRARPKGGTGKAWARSRPETPPRPQDKRPYEEQRFDHCRKAWETVGHRTALHEALVSCLQRGVPLPEWLGLATLDSMKFWIEQALVVENARRRGRPWKVLRRAELDRYAHAEMFDCARTIGLTRKDARAFAADWFNLSTDRIHQDVRDVVKAMKREPAKYFLSRSCENYLDRQRNPHNYCDNCKHRLTWNATARTYACSNGHPPPQRERHISRSTRWIALLTKYEARRPSPNFRNDDLGRIFF